MIRLLLQSRRVDMNMKDKNNQTPLAAAHAKIVYPRDRLDNDSHL